MCAVLQRGANWPAALPFSSFSPVFGAITKAGRDLVARAQL
jgi:hypothetical protein